MQIEIPQAYEIESYLHRTWDIFNSGDYLIKKK